MKQEQRFENRKKMCIKEIKDMDKEITREVVKLGTLALGVGVGVLGVIYFGRETLEIFMVNDFENILNTNFELYQIFNMIKLLFFGEIVLINFVLFKEKLGLISADIEYKRYYQMELENLCKHKARVKKRIEVKK